MHFLIIGAGGIGCYYGALLQQSGHQVSLVARGQHLKAMQQQGLQLTHPDFQLDIKVSAFSMQEIMDQFSIDDFDLVMITIKATETDNILQQTHQWLNSGEKNTPILSLQNGIDNEAIIESYLQSDRIWGGLAVRIGGQIIEPGVIQAKGPAQIIMGLWPDNSRSGTDLHRIEEFTQIFQKADIPTTLSDNIRYELWKKILINNGVNPLSALTGLDTKTLTSHKVYGDIVYQLMCEAASVSGGDDIVLTKQDIDTMHRLICDFDAIKTSMLVDREKGRPLETDAICGAIVRRGIKQGIATPVTSFVNQLLIDQSNPS